MARKRETTVKKNHPKKHPENNRKTHNQKVTKNSSTVELKLIDVSFLDLFGVLESMVLALVDVPPFSHTFCNEIQRIYYHGGTPPPFATATFAFLGLLCKVSTLAISGKQVFFPF